MDDQLNRCSAICNRNPVLSIAIIRKILFKLRHHWPFARNPSISQGLANGINVTLIN